MRLDSKASRAAARPAHGDAAGARAAAIAPPAYGIHFVDVLNAPAQRAGAPVIQMETKSAGYDKLATGQSGDTLVTSSLGNCIGVVAWDPVKQVAVMAHYNTAHSSTLDWHHEIASFEKLKTQLLNRLTPPAVPQKPKDEGMIEFRIALGMVWAAKSQELARARLSASLLSVFGETPIKGNGATVTFDVENGTLSFGGARSDALDKAWDKSAGDAIEYSAK